jgi:hypothetical protein
MPIGDFVVVIEGADEREIARAERTAATTHPTRGDIVEVLDDFYLVDRVIMTDDDEPSERVYMKATVYLRARGPRSWIPSTPVVPDPPPAPRAEIVRAEILPVGVIGAFVVHGYRELWRLYKGESKRELRLREDGWTVTPRSLSYQTASKRAKHCWRLVSHLLLEQAKLLGVDATPVVGTTEVTEAMSHLTELPPGTPYLRLVKGGRSDAPAT